MTNPDLREHKARVRRTMADARREIPPADAARAADDAAAHLLPTVAKARRVALYAAIRGELDPGPAARLLLAEGIALAFPRVDTPRGPLRFHEITDLGALRPGHLGILEPPRSLPVVPLAAIDAFVVPGLAFDRRGARLGWGKGYYDRTLLEAPTATRIGFGFASQLVENAPFGPGDAAMDCVMTEAGGVHCGRRAQTE